MDSRSAVCSPPAHLMKCILDSEVAAAAHFQHQSTTTTTTIIDALSSSSSSTSSSSLTTTTSNNPKPNQVGTVQLYGIPIVSLFIEGQERLCLAQISNTLLKQFSYNEIHNRRVALGITCVQCTPVQLEILRRAGAMPVSSRRCGMITRREAERLCKSFLGDNAPPRLPDDFAFTVHHECAWGCRGSFLPARYNSSRAKCIKCSYCGLFFSPNKFIFHSHRIGPADKYIQPDAANFNSWRRHLKLSGRPSEEVIHAWEDVKAMFNGGTRKRLMNSSSPHHHHHHNHSNGSNSSNNLNNQHLSPPKRLKEQHHHNHHQVSPPIMQAAVVVAAAAAAVAASSTSSSASTSSPTPSLQFPSQSRSTIQSNAHHHHSNLAAAVLAANAAAAAAAAASVTTSASMISPTNSHLSSQQSMQTNVSLPTDLPLPFPRSFMMDYMWQHAQHSKQAFQFQTYALPGWLKQQQPHRSPATSILFNNSNSNLNNQQSNNSNSSKHQSINCEESPKTPVLDTASKIQFNNNSAFKPVLNNHHSNRHHHNNHHHHSNHQQHTQKHQQQRSIMMVDSVRAIYAAAAQQQNSAILVSLQQPRTSPPPLLLPPPPPPQVDEKYVTHNNVMMIMDNNVDDDDNRSSDDEMVDIETTEDNILDIDDCKISVLSDSQHHHHHHYHNNNNNFHNLNNDGDDVDDEHQSKLNVNDNDVISEAINDEKSDIVVIEASTTASKSEVMSPPSWSMLQQTCKTPSSPSPTNHHSNCTNLTKNEISWQSIHIAAIH